MSEGGGSDGEVSAQRGKPGDGLAHNHPSGKLTVLRLGEGGRDQPNNAAPSSQPPHWSPGRALASRWQAPGSPHLATLLRDGASRNEAQRGWPGAGLGGAGAGCSGSDPPNSWLFRELLLSLALHCSPLQAPLAQPNLPKENQQSGETASKALDSLLSWGLNERWGLGDGLLFSHQPFLLFRCQSELRSPLKCSPPGLSSGAAHPVLSVTPSSLPQSEPSFPWDKLEGRVRIKISQDCVPCLLVTTPLLPHPPHPTRQPKVEALVGCFSRLVTQAVWNPPLTVSSEDDLGLGAPRYR